jgi:hypothetical protein
MGNISYRLGEPVSPEEASSRLANVKTSHNAKETLERIIAQLRANNVDVSRTKMTMGADLVCETASETFVGDERANLMLVRDYRKPFVVPAADNV